MRTLMRTLAGEGRTVFVSSHLLAEMANTADRLVVIGRGTADRVDDGDASSSARRRRRPGAQPAAGHAAHGADRRRASRSTTTTRPRALLVRGAAMRGGRRPGRPQRDHAARVDLAAGVAGGRLHEAHRRRRAVPGGDMSALRTSRSNAERIKLFTTRSPLWSAAAVAVLSLGLAAIQASTASVPARSRRRRRRWGSPSSGCR